MKNVQKLKSYGKAVAGSALLVGATLTGAAGAAMAQDSGSSADLENPFRSNGFVDEDGMVDASIVVGESAATIDVVGAINIAGAMSQDAYTEESVSVDAGAAGSWSAENGITLNRRNSNLYFGQDTDVEETRLDEEDIPVLATTTVQSEDNEEVELEHDAFVGGQAQVFDTEGDLDDPVLHVKNPTNPVVDSDYLLQGEVTFDSTMDFTETSTSSADSDADEVLEDGDTLELFGQEYTYSDESDTSDLILYGSSERFEVDTGESTTQTVDGEDHTFQAQYVNDAGDQGTVTVDGSTESVEDGDTLTVSGQEVRVADIYRTGADGQGRIAFSIGSEEVAISDGDVEVDGSTVDGVDVSVNGPDSGDMTAVNSIQFAFGAEDSDENFVAAGEMYETPLFGLEFHYGGLAPNAAEDSADMLEVDASDDGDAELTFTAGGEETSVQLGTVDNSDNFDYGPEDGDGKVAQYEGETVSEDDVVVLNQNEESAMYEVTNVDDTDLEDADGSADDETLSVSLRNVVTGDTVTVEEDGIDLSSDPSTHTLSDESIGGMDYEVQFEQNDDVNFVRSTRDTGHVQLWPHMYTDTDAAFAVDEPGDIDLSNVVDITREDFSGSDDSESEPYSAGNVDVDIEGGHIDGTTETANITVVDSNGNEATNVIQGDAGTVSFSSNLASDDTIEEVIVNDAEGTVTAVQLEGNTTFNPDTSVELTADIPSGVASNDATAGVSIHDTDENLASAVTPDQSFVQYGVDSSVDSSTVDLSRSTPLTGNGDDGVAVAVVEPEDEDDNEEAYVVESRVEDDVSNIDVDYTSGGPNTVRDTQSMDDEDVSVGYDYYGAYTEYDTESSDAETFTMHLPAGQSTAGMAVTGTDGALSSEGGGSASATTQSPTGFPDAAALDSDSSISSSKQEENLVLVGGPAVNSLTQELADANKTMSGDEYEQGTGMVQLVPDAFNEGNHALVVAGYSGEDTRYAANYLADHAEEDLSGQTQVDLTTGTSTS